MAAKRLRTGMASKPTLRMRKDPEKRGGSFTRSPFLQISRYVAELIDCCPVAGFQGIHGIV